MVPGRIQLPRVADREISAAEFAKLIPALVSGRMAQWAWTCLQICVSRHIMTDRRRYAEKEEVQRWVASC